MKFENDKESNQYLRRRLRKLSLLQTLVVLGLTVANLKYRVEATSHSEERKNEEKILLVEEADNNIEPAQVAQKYSVPITSQSENKTRKRNLEPEEKSDDVIVVIAVDGTLAGISKKHGKVLWKHSRDLINEDKGQNRNDNMKPIHTPEKKSKNIVERLLRPLVSTTTTTKSSVSNDYRYAAVPSIDGNVFMTSCDETVSKSVKELVSRSPFFDDKGRFYVGSRHATAAALDGNTGEILRVISSAEPGKQPDTNDTFEGRKPVWIGRVDYSVAVQDARTGMTDVQFSVAEVISVDDMKGSIGTDAWKPMIEFQGRMEHFISEEKSETGNRFRLLSGQENPMAITSATIPTGASHLFATPSGNIAFRNPESGVLQWVADENFDSPIAFAIEASSGVPLGVSIIQDVPLPGSSLDYLSREMERQLEILDDSEPETSDTIVGAMASGQLYALPLGRGRTSASKTASLQHHKIASTSASTSNNPKYISSVPQIIGRPTLHVDGVNQHNSGGRNAVSAKKQCNPSAPNFLRCMVGQNGKDVASTTSGLLLPSADINSSEDDGDESADDSGLVLIDDQIQENGGFYHPEFGYISPQTFQQFQQRRSKYHKIFRILGSWLPPTIALIFVLSFELGRRQRLSKNSDKMIDGIGEVVWSDNTPTQSSQQSVIQVSEEILGYGGQGTIVYKGMLEGRDVAVKRMLKAYHASADREISLLIESDGHPNVVRYFLKEVRGDFVYLALELCNLSLHDLIGMLRPQQEQGNEKTNSSSDEIESSISSSTKFILQQIASGVKHLHSLR
jgi:hypothetical protein